MVFIVPKSKGSRFIPVTVQRMSSTTWIIRFVRVDVALHFSNTFPGLAKIEKGIDSLPRADTDNRLTDDLTYIHYDFNGDYHSSNLPHDVFFFDMFQTLFIC